MAFYGLTFSLFCKAFSAKHSFANKIKEMKSFCKANVEIEEMKFSVLLKSKILFAKLCFALRVLQKRGDEILLKRILKAKQRGWNPLEKETKFSVLLKSKILFAKLCFALKALQRSLKSLILTRRLLKSKILFAKLCFALRVFSAK